MKRRDFLKIVGFSTAALALCPQRLSSAANPGSNHPNILWICVEDMSANMGCYGETTIHTPNIDRLAAQGTMFKHAFVTEPVCSPSRSAMVRCLARIGKDNWKTQSMDCKKLIRKRGGS